MKKYLSMLLLLVLLLPGCAGKEDSATGQNAETILRIMLGDLSEGGETNALFWYLESSDVDGYLKDYYKLEEGNWLDGAVVRMEGARAFELAVLFVDERDVETVTEALQEYLLKRKGSFTGYFPDQADLLDDALVLTRGNCVALAACQDPGQAKTAFETCFGEGVNAQGIPSVLPPSPDMYHPNGRLLYVDPGTDDMTLFDSSTILAAWESGDSSGLSMEDKAVLDAAKAAFEACITLEMSDYDRELALYTWLTTHVDYDQSHYSKQGAPRTSYQPYGPLINGTGVCLGYATTFQLLMDMAGIECITVIGAGFQNEENHAWNMVCLDGAWYCVDSTWDSGPDVAYFGFRYFNVTSDWMARTGHQWDYDSTPEATTEDGGRPQA